MPHDRKTADAKPTAPRARVNEFPCHREGPAL